MTEITVMQHKYLLELQGGARTTREVTLSLCVTTNATSRMMKILRDAGLVRSSRKLGSLGNVWRHEIIGGYGAIAGDLVIIQRKSENRGKPHTVTAAEFRYVAELRTAGLTGRELIAEYHKRYPDQPATTVKNRLQKARQMGLCR